MKKLFSTIVGSLLFSATLFAAPMALADEEDKAACADLDEGDECTRGDGDPGICIPDDSDPILTCDDDTLASGGGGSSSGSGDGCSASGASSTGAGLALALAAALAVGARRCGGWARIFRVSAAR